MLNKILESILIKREALLILFTRYSLYSFALFESFLLPKLIDGNNYSQFEYYKNLIFLFPNFLLGSYSGYVYLKYVKGVDYYKQLFEVGILVSIFLAVVGSIFTKNYYILVPFLVFSAYTLTEQKLKIERKFVPIFAFKPILSILSVLIATISYFFQFLTYNYNWSILIVFGLGFLFWILLFKLPNNNFPISFTFNKIKILRYTLMVKVIVTGVLASFLFGLLVFFERFYIKEFYREYLPTYSLAFNLSQIIAVLLSAVGYITSVELGEQLTSINKYDLIKNFKKGLYIFLLFLAIFTLFVFLIHPYYAKFEYLVLMTFIVSYSKGFFFLVGTISPLAVYNDFNTKMFLFLLKIFIINIALIYIMIYLNANIFLLLTLDSIFIIIYALYILDIVFNKIKYSNTGL